jgi:DNA polymerase (family 10)
VSAGRNVEAAARLELLADFLEAREVEYKPETYRTAAANVRNHPVDLADLAAEGPEAVREIEGVGEAIAEKLIEYAETGEIAELAEQRERLPVDMAALTAVEGVGPKTVAALHEALGIETLDDLEAAARNGEIREVSGFGEKTEQNIRERVAFARESRERTRLGEARPLGEAVREFVTGLESVERVALAGSLRRWKETIGDVDALAAVDDTHDTGDAAERAVEAFADWERADERIEAGRDKASVRISDVRVDLRVIDSGEFGAALQYFTGSREHNIRLRSEALDRDLKINEYGVFDVSEVADPDSGRRVGERVAGETEREIYGALDLPFIPPELREDIGEIDAARRDALPDLLEPTGVRGDLHVHSDWSDGGHSVEAMAEAAADAGHDYLAITDHAAGTGIVGGTGLSEADLREQIQEIRAVAADAEVDVFAGVEANVDADGDVGGVSEGILADLDLVIASPHSGLGADDATDRLCRAIEHHHVDVLGHPTGRLINERPGLRFDTEAVAERAAAEGVALEVNSNPARLDLNGGRVRTAVEAGAAVAVSTDAHGPREYGNVEYGVHTARRGWAEPADVLNARDADGIREFLES